MPATIGNTAVMEKAVATTDYDGTITLGSGSRRKVVLCILGDNVANPTTVTINSVSPTGRGDLPDVNPNDTALKMWWYDYDVPSGVPSGSLAISVRFASNTTDATWHAWEVLDAADGAPEATQATHTSGAAATASVTASGGAALVAASVIHAGTQTIAFTGDVVERAETNPANFTSAAADAGNVTSGTRTATATASGGGRTSVRLLSYAQYVATIGPGYRPYYEQNRSA